MKKNEKCSELCKLFYKAMAGGIFTNIGATIYLQVENKVVGALLFTLGMFGTLLTESNLFTGMSGYFPKRKWWELSIVFVGNAVGCIVYSLGYSMCASHQKLYERTYQLCEYKFGGSVPSILFLSICCGALIFLGVDTFKKNRNVIGVVIALMCVSGFILADFENSIANMSYLALAQYPVTLEILGKLLLMGLGNFIGAIGLRKIME